MPSCNGVSGRTSCHSGASPSRTSRSWGVTGTASSAVVPAVPSLRWAHSANSPRPGWVNTSVTVSVQPFSRSPATRRREEMLSPPRPKKSSRGPDPLMPSSSSTAAHTARCAGVPGVPPRPLTPSGSGSAARSILPLGVIGRALSSVTTVGIM